MNRTLNTQSAGPALPVRPNHGPDGTQPSSDTPPATAVVVLAASAPDGRREDEGCVVDGLSRLRGVTSHDFRHGCSSSGAADTARY